MRQGKEYRNDVMVEAFSRLDVGDQLHSPLVKKIAQAYKRFKPSSYGTWRVNGKRRTDRGGSNR